MKYHSDPKWKEAEQKGHITKATKLLMDEMQKNCENFPSNLPQKSSLIELCNNNYYVKLLTSVPHSTFIQLKESREELKKFIEHFRMPE